MTSVFNRSWETCGSWFAWTCQKTVFQSFPQRSAALLPSQTCCSRRTISKSCRTALVKLYIPLLQTSINTRLCLLLYGDMAALQ